MTLAPDLVRILDADPDLGEGLSAEQRQVGRRALVAEAMRAPPGHDLAAGIGCERQEHAIGLLLLEGVVLRSVELVGRIGVELVGPGDVIRPWTSDDQLASVPARVRWEVAEPVRAVVLDDDLQELLARFPDVLRRLIARFERRSGALALNLALARLPRLDDRLLVLFWHLADRFGRVDADGIVLPLNLPHRTLAELVFAQRQSVTRALRTLGERGLVQRRGAGTWIIRGEPPRTAARLRRDLPSGIATAS